MKASEMICLLAKQIEMKGDRDVTLVLYRCVDYNGLDAEGAPLSVTWSEDNKTIEIYGE
jgi:hypothetical protein